MEELLNKLIKKGWRIENPNARISDVKYMHGLRELRIVYDTDRRDAIREYPIRFLVSKESGLWQFCVENNLIDYSGVRAYGISFAPLGIQSAGAMQNYDNVHRLLWDCASLDEDKLEDFILQNVKIDE